MFELAIFYCQHQTDRMMQILGSLNNLAGSRIRKVALPCSGKLEVFQLTKALENGADGVVLFGCPEGECRYVVGSSRAKGRVSYAGKILETIGLEKDRVRRFVLEGQPDQETLRAISVWVETIKTMGSFLENSQ
jgi:F420-non-reducing hydrogenase iron-sulfur subunit